MPLYLCALFLFIAGLIPGAAFAEGFSARFSGGYGFSLNSTPVVDGAGIPQRLPGSPGIPAGFEVLYTPRTALQVGLGVFPVFLNRSSVQRIFIYDPNTLSFYNTAVHVNDSALYAPVLVSAYLSQALSEGLALQIGVGAGVVPATTVSHDLDQGLKESPTYLDAGLALRGSLTMNLSLSQHLSLGAGVQALTFNQSRLLSGFSQWTQDFNQIAPMLSLEWKI